LLERSLKTREAALGEQNPALASILENLGRLYEKEGKYAEAEVVLRRSLAIREKSFGPNQPNLAGVLLQLSRLYEKTGKTEEAKKYGEQAAKLVTLK